MTFGLFPDPPDAPLTIGANIRVDSSFGQQAGAPPPELAGLYAAMMYLRVAMIGGTAVPRLFLTAGTGPAVEVTADPTPVYRQTTAGVGTGFVGDVFRIAQDANVSRLVFGFDTVSTQTWKLGIHNTDPAVAHLYTWAVADTADDAAQPWVDPTAFVPSFAEPATAQFAPASGVAGVPVTLAGSNFHIGTARVSFGEIAAAQVAAPTPTQLTVAAPAGLTPGADVPITVSTDAGTVTSALKFHVIERPVVVVGRADHGVAALAATLAATGTLTVTTGAQSFTDGTDLVIVVVSCRDGPMPQTRESLLALNGRVLPRLAIVLTDVDAVADPEIHALVVLEMREVLAGIGIEPVGPDQVIKTTGADIAVDIDRVLATPRRDYRVVAP